MEAQNVVDLSIGPHDPLEEPAGARVGTLG
jgi:hypothetical protein